MFNRLSKFAKYLTFIISFFVGAFLDGLINNHNTISDARLIFIWVLPLIIFLLLSAIHKASINSKILIFLLPLFIGTLGGLIFGGKFIFSPFYLYSLAVIGVGAGTGIVFSLLFICFFDKNIIDSEIRYKWLLVLDIATPFIFYCIHEVYNLMIFNPAENMLRIVLNLIAALFGLSFLVKTRNAAKSLDWKIIATLGMLFSVFMLLGGLGAYRVNKLINQIPNCSTTIKFECLNESGSYIFKN